MKKLFIIIVLFFLSFSFALAEENQILPAQTGIIQSVEYVDIENDIAQVKQIVEIKIIEGINKNQLIKVDNMLTGNPYYDIKLKSGMKVILHVEKSHDGLIYSIEDIQADLKRLR